MPVVVTCGAHTAERGVAAMHSEAVCDQPQFADCQRMRRHTYRCARGAVQAAVPRLAPVCGARTRRRGNASVHGVRDNGRLLHTKP
jgi:hypothetical protein